MDLQSDQSSTRDAGLLLLIVHRALAIEVERDVVADGGDHVFIPSILVESGEAFGRRLHQHLAAARLVVEASPILLSDVGLEAGKLMGCRNYRAAELDPAVAFAVDQAEFQAQDEIAARASIT